MKNYTDMTILLDRSGSMGKIKNDMEGGFDTFLKEHKSVPSTKVTLIEFDDVNDCNVVYQNVPVGGVESLRIRPRGNTPLLDAMAKSIDLTGRRLASLDESERPERVLFIVITDGEENASRTYKRHDVSKRVQTQSDTYKWNFIYLGANQDSFKESQSLGFNYANVLKWSPDTYSISNTYRSLTASTVGYASGEMPMAGSFTAEQRVNSATQADLDKESAPKDLKQRLADYKATKGTT